MTDQSPKVWLRDWLSQKTPGRELADNENFFEAGGIGSFAVIGLIEAIELHFQRRFSEGDFQDRRFPTIAGLAELVSEKLGNVES